MFNFFKKAEKSRSKKSFVPNCGDASLATRCVPSSGVTMAQVDSGWEGATGVGGDWGPGDGGDDWQDYGIPGSDAMISDSITWILESDQSWGGPSDGGSDWGNTTGVGGDWGPGDGGDDWGPL